MSNFQLLKKSIHVFFQMDAGDYKITIVFRVPEYV